MGLKWLKSRCSQGCIPSGNFKGESSSTFICSFVYLFTFFQFLEADYISWLMCFLLFKFKNGWKSLLHSIPLWHCSLFLALIRFLVIALGPVEWSEISPPSQGQLISKLNFICKLNSSLPHNTYAQVPGIRRWISFGGQLFYLLSHSVMSVLEVLCNMRLQDSRLGYGNTYLRQDESLN